MDETLARGLPAWEAHLTAIPSTHTTLDLDRRGVEAQATATSPIGRAIEMRTRKPTMAFAPAVVT